MRRWLVQFLALIVFTTIFHISIVLKYQHAIKELTDWRRESVRNIAHYLNLEVKTLPNNFCQDYTTLLVLVHAKPDSKEARNAIRNTWAQKSLLKKHNSSLFFLMGRSRNSLINEEVMDEISNHRDIVMEDFVDSYANLTLKSVSMLKLFIYRKNCRYLLKTDEDMFVNVAAIVDYLETKVKNNSLLVGRLISKEIRKNDYNNRWYAPKYMYLGRKYPDFLAGPAYMMSLDVAEKLYKAALQEPLFHLEDVFLTGICAQNANIRRNHSTHFIDYTITKKNCNMLNLFAAHGFKPPLLETVYAEFEKIVLMCPRKFNTKM